ncbi:MAG: hypothetical protein AAB288_07350, partial [Acidobacteriota bacterium]
ILPWRRAKRALAWGSWGAKVRDSMKRKDKNMHFHGGVILLQMRLPFADDEIGGWLDVAVSPSTVIPNFTGVFLGANHHHQTSYGVSEGKKVNQEPSASDLTHLLLTSLSERFDDSIDNSESIFQEVINS